MLSGPFDTFEEPVKGYTTWRPLWLSASPSPEVTTYSLNTIISLFKKIILLFRRSVLIATSTYHGPVAYPVSVIER